MRDEIEISVVIPTCNRKKSLIRLLDSLSKSKYPLMEVIIVDSGDQKLEHEDLKNYRSLNIRLLTSPRSVCIQRNAGISMAKGAWIFLCDDDVEVPPEYLSILSHHFRTHPDAGAVSGLFLQRDNFRWEEQHPVKSTLSLLWRYIFQLSLWGEIRHLGKSKLAVYLEEYYRKKGNHLSKAGWPVLTDFSSPFFRTPVYGLGAAVIKKEWLLNSPYEEVLDPHGIGDNYGVASGFPEEGIHVLKSAFVYHHFESHNRSSGDIRYFRRALALDYFLNTRPRLSKIRRRWFIWSLFGNLLAFTLRGEFQLARAAAKSWLLIILKQNPYLEGARKNKKIITPAL
jgi:glycosyltransferase involved in cell wall biosynthesis